MSYRVFGIRHHGPGCARSLQQALDAMQPDCVLVEGPPEADEIIHYLVHEQMKPPVALLVYPVENPGNALFYPYTIFSPEYQAICHALRRSIPVRFMDLPATQMAAMAADKNAEQATESESTEDEDDQPTIPLTRQLHIDPIAVLAETAGYSDRELWWEHQVERRSEGQEIFDAIAEAMIALREQAIESNMSHEEKLREAWMRKSIRAALKEGFTSIAVVCGAWHLPALITMPSAKSDNELLAGINKKGYHVAWTPWTNMNLSYKSGYGAGIEAPGWYELVWHHPKNAPLRWIIEAARLLRSEGLDVSSANVIDTMRLSHALTALRDTPVTGIAELTESIRSVICGGNDSWMDLIRTRLEIGQRMGEIPADAPATPLQRDLENWQRRLRLKQSTEIRLIDLDLREESGLHKSWLLHRLNLLGIAWGTIQKPPTKSSSFHEYWQLQWHVEFVIQLVASSTWGATIEKAATQKTLQHAGSTKELSTLTTLLDKVVLAGLHETVEKLLVIVADCAAISSDVRHMMEALPPLSAVARYGDARGTQSNQVFPIISCIFSRVVVSLAASCTSLDDDAARSMRAAIDGVTDSLRLLQIPDMAEQWRTTLRQMLDTTAVHSHLRGRILRTLIDDDTFDATEIHRRIRLSLSLSLPVATASSWIEGFISGSSHKLIHEEIIWKALNTWISELSEENFITLLPVLRRTFAEFEAPQRRAMLEIVQKVSHSQPTDSVVSPNESQQTPLNIERAQLMLPVLRTILGLRDNE